MDRQIKSKTTKVGIKSKLDQTKIKTESNLNRNHYIIYSLYIILFQVSLYKRFDGSYKTRISDCQTRIGEVLWSDISS